MAKEAKVETKTKKILNAVIITIEIIIIIAGIIFSIISISGSRTTIDKLGGGINLTAVLSDSMDRDDSVFDQNKIKSFKIGDVLLIKNIANNKEEQDALQVGDVLTYKGVGPTGEYGLISHRIYKIEEKEIGNEKVRIFLTLGDKQYTGHEEVDLYNAQEVTGAYIQGKVIGQAPTVGNALIWLHEPNNFLWAIVIPLALLLAYNVYLFIRMIVDYKIKKAKEESQLAVEAIKNGNALNEEEIKKKAIEEFLAQQNAQNDIQDASNVETKTEDIKKEEPKEDK